MWKHFQGTVALTSSYQAGISWPDSCMMTACYILSWQLLCKGKALKYTHSQMETFEFFRFLSSCIYYFHLCSPSLPPPLGKYNYLQVLIIRTVIIRVDILSIFFSSIRKRKKQKATKPNGAILLQKSNANLQVIINSVWTHFLSLFLVQNIENSWPLRCSQGCLRSPVCRDKINHVH